MGATPATRPPFPVLVCTVLLAFGGACASPVARPPAEAAPPISTPPAVAQPAEAVSETRASFRWPASGWVRLDLDVFVALDADADVGATAILAARWEAGDVEIWIDAPDPGALGDRATAHRRGSGAAADEAVDGLRGTFEAALAEGLESSADARPGVWVFAATDRADDTTVSQRWQIGEGGAPWGPDGPFAPGS
jgi:hypothetical protein